MSNIIQLLPDSIANQIAAGEVIQRPASVVKELLENAIDAGATKIQVIVKDSGKTLIQVIDNGVGMSDTDARMSFERHATSKISTVDDIYALNTMGFRGEALASIASVAMVDLLSRRTNDDLATAIKIYGSKVEDQSYTAAPLGTNISVKNLFFNTPARRKFLKSDPVEFRHILEEVHRVVLAHPDIQFVLYHNDKEILHLPAVSLRQRVSQLFGKNSNEKLVPINEDTEIVNITGFISKPEAARKTRGQQYFFVNRRYFRSGYLHHAVMKAFEKLIAPELYPSYAIYLELDPASVDVNIHPTKQEVKFENERLLYQYLSVSIRHALGKYAAVPSLDFNPTPQFLSGASQGKGGTKASEGFKKHRPDITGWEQMFEGTDRKSTNPEDQANLRTSAAWDEDQELDIDRDGSIAPVQIHKMYILSQIKSGFILIHQHHAHYRVLYDQLMAQGSTGNVQTQRLLFPETVQLPALESGQADDLLPYLNDMGFEIESFGKDSLIVHGTPAVVPRELSVSQLISRIIDDLGKNIPQKDRLEHRMYCWVAKSGATRAGTKLNVEEMQLLIDALFRCRDPYQTPEGKPCFIQYDLDVLARRFKI